MVCRRARVVGVVAAHALCGDLHLWRDGDLVGAFAPARGTVTILLARTALSGAGRRPTCVVGLAQFAIDRTSLWVSPLDDKPFLLGRLVVWFAKPKPVDRVAVRAAWRDLA